MTTITIRLDDATIDDHAGIPQIDDVLRWFYYEEPSLAFAIEMEDQYFARLKCELRAKFPDVEFSDAALGQYLNKYTGEMIPISTYTTVDALRHFGLEAQ